MDNENLKRIADALEEILRLVKQDMERMKKLNEETESMKPNAGKEYNKILINHWRWLEAQGPSYKQQATSCKLQAASLTRKLYNDIGVYRRKICKQKKL